MAIQLNISERNLSPRVSEQMEEENAKEEILLRCCWCILSGTISVPLWDSEDELEDEKYIDDIQLIVSALWWVVLLSTTTKSTTWKVKHSVFWPNAYSSPDKQ